MCLYMLYSVPGPFNTCTSVSEGAHALQLHELTSLPFVAFPYHHVPRPAATFRPSGPCCCVGCQRPSRNVQLGQHQLTTGPAHCLSCPSHPILPKSNAHPESLATSLSLQLTEETLHTCHTSLLPSLAILSASLETPLLLFFCSPFDRQQGQLPSDRPTERHRSVASSSLSSPAPCDPLAQLRPSSMVQAPQPAQLLWRRRRSDRNPCAISV